MRQSGSVHFKVIDLVSDRHWKIDPAKTFSRDKVMWLAISRDITWQYSQD